MQKGANMLRCRFCKSTDHMSAYCPYKDLVENTMETLESVSSGDAATDEKSRQKELEDKVKSGTYVPPSMLRAGAGGAPPSRSMDTSRRDDFTVRVTNLPEETIEEDLKELFGNVGKVQRVFLAKDKSTGRCKGFAFVTFCNREDAEKGIQTISGHKYDHLILKVEWARPTN
uniref:RRM domain-containing protein n=1 Tax=Romanomermis culicivorax TaxID=13658 RepID=A0A915HR07_ROMCU